jgi:hypothetical protein
MTDPREKKEEVEQTKPAEAENTEIDDKDLDKAAGGSGWTKP